MRFLPFNFTAACAQDAPGVADVLLPTPTPAAARPFIPDYDLHNHTIYCGHADDDATVLNLLSRASSLELSAIGISEHIMQPSDLAGFRCIENELHSLVTMGAQPLLGVEMDVDPTDPEGRWVVPDIQCDYVILSAHGFPQFDMGIPESDRLLPPEQQRKHLATCWLTWYGNAVRRGGFHVMGHPLREPIIMNLVNLNDPEVMDLAYEALRPAIEQAIAFELNNAFLGALELTTQYDAYVVLVRRLRDAGMKFSRGSDSHGLIRVGAADNVSAMADDAQLLPQNWLDVRSLPRRAIH